MLETEAWEKFREKKEKLIRSCIICKYLHVWHERENWQTWIMVMPQDTKNPWNKSSFSFHYSKTNPSFASRKILKYLFMRYWYSNTICFQKAFYVKMLKISVLLLLIWFMCLHYHLNRGLIKRLFGKINQENGKMWPRMNKHDQPGNIKTHQSCLQPPGACHSQRDIWKCYSFANLKMQESCLHLKSQTAQVSRLQFGI